jgi:glycosyltransferase involved in cell wall biosynthesis
MAAVVRGLLESDLGERYELTSITTHRTGSMATRLAVASSGWARLLAWCLRHPDGLVHIHAAVRGSLYRKAVAILIARAARRPVLVQLHAGPGDIDAFVAGLTPAARALFRIALRRAQSIVSVSEASARALSSAFGLGQVGVIPNAAPAGPEQPPPANGTAALFLGGFEDPAKGGLDLVAVLPDVLRSVADLRIELAGPGEPPPELSTLDGGRVRWRGWLDVDGKARAFAEAGIVLMPSRSEGLPIVLLEAMAHGRAVVATRVGGIPDVITDGVDGLLVDPGDGPALTDAIRRLAHDPTLVQRLGAAAAARVAELSEPRVLARIDALYRSLLPG